MTVRDFENPDGKHPIFVGHLNEVVARVNDVYDMAVAPPLMLSKVHGFQLSLTQEIPRFVIARVKEEFNNYLRCRLWNGTADGADDLYVAKPFKLRHVLANYTSLSALTTVDVNEVEVTDAGETKTWTVKQDYDVDSEIYARYVRTTGVAGPGALADIAWVDVNTDGREWYEDTSGLVPFRIKSVQNDYLTCRTWDGTNDGDTDVLIAKPFLLRHLLANYPWLTSFTTVGASQATVVYSSVSYTWKVTLPYAVNEVIWAHRSGLGDVTVSGDPLVWEDANHGAHAWGVEP